MARRTVQSGRENQRLTMDRAGRFFGILSLKSIFYSSTPLWLLRLLVEIPYLQGAFFF